MWDKLMQLLLGKLVEWLVANLTQEKLKEWAEKAQLVVIPFLHAQKDWLIQKLRIAAADTATQIDDSAVNALESFLNAFLPPLPPSP